MPTYTYKCKNCDHRFEVRQRFSDDPVKECPHCHVNGDVRRVISPVGVVFKGSGFYVTDNRSSSNGRANGSTSSQSSEEKTDKPAKSDKVVSGKSDSKDVGAKPSSP